MTHVPLVDLRAAHAEVADEVDLGFKRVLEAAAFVGGEEVRAFEGEYAAFCGLPHCLGVANGTDALALALRAAGVRAMATHGGPGKYRHETLGWNSRLDALQAVVLRSKLSRLSDWNRLRRAAAARYDELLNTLDVVRPAVLVGNEPVWHLYVVRIP